MKTTISILNWINRIFMVPFVISLLLGIIDLGFLYYSALIAVVLAVFQVCSFLISIICFKKMGKQSRFYLTIYGSLILVYATSCFLILNANDFFDSIDFLRFIIWISPVLLSIFWTFILESLNKVL